MTSKPRFDAVGLLTWVRDRLHGRADTEHVMSFNRALFCMVLTGYLLNSGLVSLSTVAVIAVAGFLITAGLFVHIVVSPAVSPVRRVVALVADITTICVVLKIGGQNAAIFYPLIIWTIIGNGLRFGVFWLRLATVIGLIGFAVTAAMTPFWRDDVSLSIGLMIGQIMLPLYAGALIGKLTKAKSQAETANQAKNLFLASVSHELRTPLQAIIGTGDLLGKTRLTADQAEMSRTIMDASGALLSMIEDLLQFSRIEAGVVTIEASDFEVLALLDEVRGMILPACRKKGLRLTCHVGVATPLKVRADQRHIREILLNLANNAAKFTEKGGLLLAIDVHSSPDRPPMLLFEIVDTGIGVPAEAQDRIFERFTQGDKTISDRFGGTGLGLALCRSLAAELGGEVGVRSVAGYGSTFWLRVPFEPSDQVPPGHGSAPVEQPLTVLMPNNEAKGRLSHQVRARADVVWLSFGTSTPVAALDEAVLAGHCLVMETPPNLVAAQELEQAAGRLEAGRSIPLLLIDGPVLPGLGRDVRWLAPTRLPERFTAGDLQAALAIIGWLNSHRSASQPAPAHEHAADINTPRLNILVADDNRTNQLVFRKILESGGHVVEIAKDGFDVLDALERTDFDVVLIDVNMPALDGIEATKLQRVAELGLRRIPIIGLTADVSPVLAQRCRDAGMDDVVTKPITAKALLEIVLRVGVRERGDGPAMPEPVAALASVQSGVRPDAVTLDPSYLASLEKIGGLHFVFEVAGEFARDAGELIQAMIAALDKGDLGEFQSNAHALGSCAANLGASRLSQLGLDLERIAASRFTGEGRKKVAELVEELDHFVKALAERSRPA